MYIHCEYSLIKYEHALCPTHTTSLYILHKCVNVEDTIATADSH